jgi:hypothetical protein
MLVDQNDFDYAIQAGVEPDEENLAVQAVCENLLVTSFMLLDSGQGEKYRALFTVDGAQSFDDTEYRGPNLTELARERDRWVAAGRDTRHTVTSMLYRRRNANTAIIRSVGAVYLLSNPDVRQRRVPLAVIDIWDIFARQPDSHWLIAERRINFLASQR